MFLHFFLVLLLSLPSTITVAARHRNETDRLALLAFRAKIEEHSYGVLSSWNHSLHFCNWIGITCSKRHPYRVIALNLSRQSLVGTLSPHLANLTFLRVIDLSKNSFHGEIPQELSRLLRLRHLNLNFNSLEGEIPANLSYCKELAGISIASNLLNRKIPVELGSLPKPRTLILERNNLIGPIPPSLGNLTSLTILSLSGNQLEGTIPDALGRLKNLTWLGIGVNGLSGTLPTSFYNLSFLQILFIGDNDLEGHLPPDIGFTLPNLQKILAGGNRFWGPIPISFANASGLETIELSENQLSGSVPTNLGSLKRLQRLSLHCNRLTSAGGDDGLNFMISLTNCSILKTLNLGYNKLSGTLPSTIANLSAQMEKFVLRENQISGTIPAGIENLLSLNSLHLASNLLTGKIPDGIGKLSNLEGLGLFENKFSGQIPSSFGNLTKLSLLFLHDNQLEGGIPFSLGNCHHLERFYLDRNKLNSTIPRQVMTLPSVIDFVVSNNFLTGVIPLEIGSMKSIQVLYMSSNKLTGEIPNTLGNCLDIRKIFLDGNYLEGSIPSMLSVLNNVEIIDLSRNNLSGEIPDFIEKYAFLLHLNLSFNDFEGEVPKHGVLRNATTISILGNKKLCGGVPELYLQPCAKVKSKKKLQHRVIILLATLGALLALLSSFLGVFCWIRRSKKKDVSAHTMKDSSPHLSYGQLLKATDGFASCHLIGAGSYGSVYKGSLEPVVENVVAIKVLNLQLKGAWKSFRAECEVLKNIRHRNLVKLLNVCSSIDFKGNDFKALILEYMPMGSIEKWLHCTEYEEHQVLNLNFLQRLNIAIDVASAFDYLHHDFDVPVVHRDLKPSNVLLDDDMVAHVSDFGLAKLLHEAASNGSHNQTSSFKIKGTIGYVAPEYGMGATTSTQGDVYSFGVLLLEMFTGKRPTDNMFKGHFNLHQYAVISWPEQVLEIVDPRLLLEADAVGEHDSDHGEKSKIQVALVSLIKIGITCSMDCPNERMDIRSVIMELHAIKNSYVRS